MELPPTRFSTSTRERLPFPQCLDRVVHLAAEVDPVAGREHGVVIARWPRWNALIRVSIKPRAACPAAESPASCASRSSVISRR